MDTTKNICNYKIGCTLLIVLISVLMFGIIFFCTRKARIRPTIKRHTVICKYMGMEFFEGTATLAPDFGKFPAFLAIKYPRICTPKVATDIGITILSSIYGKRIVEIQKPYKVSLINDEIWEIRGRLPYRDFYIMIQQFDSRVLSINGYSYTEYLEGRNDSYNNLSMLDFINNSAYNWTYKDNDLFSDYINNEICVAHSTAKYDYLGSKHVEKLPFVRLPFDGYTDDEGKNPVMYEWIKDNGYTPDSSVRDLPNGVLRDYETAAKVGIIILSSILGDKDVKKQFPFEVFLTNTGSWSLDGSLYPIGSAGGTAHIDIQKSDCRILALYHEK